MNYLLLTLMLIHFLVILALLSASVRLPALFTVARLLVPRFLVSVTAFNRCPSANTVYHYYYYYYYCRCSCCVLSVSVFDMFILCGLVPRDGCF